MWDLEAWQKIYIITQRPRKDRKSTGDAVLGWQRASPAVVGCTNAAGKMIWLLGWHVV